MNKEVKIKERITLLLLVLGCAGALFYPFIGYLFFIGAFVLSFKKETKEAQHLLLASIVCTVAVTILTITTFIKL